MRIYPRFNDEIAENARLVRKC